MSVKRGAVTGPVASLATEAGIEEYSFHRVSHDGCGIGVSAELYTVPRPVIAHRHDFYEIAFAMAGSGQHEDEGGRLPILSGDVWAIAPGQWHAYPLVGGGLQICNVLITTTCLATYAPAIDVACLGLGAQAQWSDEAGLKQPIPMAVRRIHLSPRGQGRINPLLATLSTELQSPSSRGQTALCVGLVLQILGLLDRYGTSEGQQSSGMLAARADPGVLAAVQHIEERYADPITLRELAAYSGYAPTYLTRKFRQRLGLPPSDYLLQVRLHHACTLLERTDLPVTTIAHQVGFSDSRYFATRFHRTLGLPPTGFRQKAQDKITNKEG